MSQLQRSMMAPRPAKIAALAAATHCGRVPFGPLPFRLGPATVSCRAQHSIFLETHHHSFGVPGSWLSRCATSQHLLVQILHTIHDLAEILSCQDRRPCSCPTQRPLAVLLRPRHFVLLENTLQFSNIRCIQIAQQSYAATKGWPYASSVATFS